MVVFHVLQHVSHTKTCVLTKGSDLNYNTLNRDPNCNTLIRVFLPEKS